MPLSVDSYGRVSKSQLPYLLSSLQAPRKCIQLSIQSGHKLQRSVWERMNILLHHRLGVQRAQFQLCPCSSHLLWKAAKTILAFKTSWSYWCNEMSFKFTCPNLALVTSFSELCSQMYYIGSSLTVRISHKAQRQLPHWVLHVPISAALFLFLEPTG